MGLGILLGMGGWIMWVLICLHYIVVVVVGCLSFIFPLAYKASFDW